MSTSPRPSEVSRPREPEPAAIVAAGAELEPLAARLSIWSSPGYLPLLRVVVRWACEHCGLSELETHRTVLALVEAVTNIIKHAYDGGRGEIELEFREIREPRRGVELVLLDRGRFVAHSDCRGRDLEDVRPGGLGVHMMDLCLDELHAEEREGGGRRLVLRKYADESSLSAGESGTAGPGDAGGLGNAGSADGPDGRDRTDGSGRGTLHQP